MYEDASCEWTGIVSFGLTGILVNREVRRDDINQDGVLLLARSLPVSLITLQVAFNMDSMCVSARRPMQLTAYRDDCVQERIHIWFSK